MDRPPVPPESRVEGTNLRELEPSKVFVLFFWGQIAHSGGRTSFSDL